MSTADSRPLIQRTREDLAALKGSPRELWLVFAIQLLESIAYFAITNILVIYLSEDLKYSDVEAGKIYGMWATLISVMTFVAGMVADGMGIRTALLVSVLSSVLGRGLLALADSRSQALLGLLISSWGTAALFPTMVAGVKRYTRSDTVSFAFSFFYVVMNVGAFIAPLTIGSLRKRFSSAVAAQLPVLGAVTLTSSKVIFMVGVVTTVLALGVAACMRHDDEVELPAGDKAEPTLREAAAGITLADDVAEATSEAPAVPASRPAPARGLGFDVLRDPGFWRFMLFVTLLVMVKLIFQHAHQTWPKYALRELGKDFDFASYWSINPFMIMLFTPLATALTRDLSAFRCIVVGSFITAASVFFMAASTTVGASVAFIVTLSIGEMLWSPRLYEYTATIAPKGREASYMGLSSVPMFFAKMTVGWLSGTMLATWCPESGPRASQTMWLVIGLMTLAGPVLIVLLRRVIEGGSTQEEEALAA